MDSTWEARFRALFDHMNEEVHVWDVVRDGQGRIVTWRLADANPRALKTWGMALSEIRGKTADEIFGPGTTEHYLPVVEKVMRDGALYSFEDYLASLDKHFRFTSFALGEQFFTTGVEITELRQAERERRLAHQRLTAVMNAVPVGVSYSTDATCLSVTGNPALLAQFEATAADNVSASAEDPNAVGRHVRFFRDGVAVPARELPLQRAAAENREIAPMELEIHMPSGREWFADASGAPIRDQQGNVIGGVGVCVDVTERKRKENELRELAQRLTYHVDQSPLAVIEWGPDMRLVRWSGAAERVFGWKAEEVIGRRMEEIGWIHMEDRARVAEVAEDLRSGRDPHRFSANRNYRKDGSVIHCEWYNSSLVDGSGELRSILSLVLDVTERKLAEESLRESRDWMALAQRIAQAGSFDVDLATGHIVWSDELQQLYGFGPGEPHVRLQDWVEWVEPEDRERVMAEFDSGIQCGEVMSQFRIRRRDTGELRWIEGRGRTIRDASGKPVRMVGFSMDISRQKTTEEELQLSAENYRRSNEQLKQFTYVVSHDLQEPLRNISTASTLLERRLDGQLSEDESQLFELVRGGAARMRSLIDDLLAYSLVELEEHETAAVDMQGVLMLAMEHLRQSITASGAEITWDELPRVQGSHVRLLQLMQNLIGNAIKYRSEAKPRIHVRAEEDRAGWKFRVRDNGIGIDPRYHERIFGMFKRLHSTAEYPGTGIGLAICKKIVERHGGRIWVESEHRAGSTFVFTLPAAAEGRAAAAGLTRAVLPEVRDTDWQSGV